MDKEQSAPLVSIITPTYNVEKFVAQTIRSVLDQTYSNWELILVDDGSTDNTADVVAPFLSDKRIQFYRQVNQGASAARNNAISHSNGSLIAFLDADDWWKPEKLVRQWEIFQKYPEIGVCATGLQCVDENGTEKNSPVADFFHGIAVPRLFYNISVPMSSTLVRKEVFDEVGVLDLTLPCAMDFDFWLRAAVKFQFYKIPEPLTIYRTQSNSISAKNGDRRRDIVMFKIVPRFLKEHGGSKYVKWYHVWGLHSNCYFGRACGRTTWGQRTYWLIRSLMCNPKNIDAAGALAGQFLPRWCILVLKKFLRR